MAADVLDMNEEFSDIRALRWRKGFAGIDADDLIAEKSRIQPSA
jgi:hypothetical protein